MSDDEGKLNPYLNLPDDDPEEPDNPELGEWPKPQMIPARWLVTLLLLCVLLVALRLLGGSNETGTDKMVISDTGVVYRSGDLVENGPDEDSSLVLNVQGTGRLELLPGSSVVIRRPKDDESARFKLDHGRCILDAPNPEKKAVMEIFATEVVTLGGRMFMEAWGEVDDPRLRVGLYDGTAGVVTDENVMLGLSAGDAMFSVGSRFIYPLASPANTWPARSRYLERWVFTGLNSEEYPSVRTLLEEVGRQAGMKIRVPENTRLSDLFAPVEFLDIEPRRAADVFDQLGLRYGFRYTISGSEVYIKLLTQDQQLAAVGEELLFSFEDDPSLIWPGNFPRDDSTGIRTRLEFMIGLAAMPLENRIGALAAMIASRDIFPGEEQALWDAELGLVTDFTQPYHLRRIAFRDLYEDSELPVDLGMSIFEEADLWTARNYHRLRAWSRPAWSDEETVAAIEKIIDDEIDARDDSGGKLVAGLWRGIDDNVLISDWLDLAFFKKDNFMHREILLHLNRLSYSADQADSLLMKKMLKKVLSLSSSDGQILALDAIMRLAPHIERDGNLLRLVTPYITEVKDPLTQYAAVCVGHMVSVYGDPEDSGWIQARVSDISDPTQIGSDVALMAAGRIDGLETLPGLAYQSIIDALRTRLEQIKDEGEILKVIRLIKGLDTELNGKDSYHWIEGAAGDAVRDLLKSKIPDMALETALSLELYIPETLPEEAGSIVFSFRLAMGGYASSTDPRLRLLAAHYFSAGDVPASESLLEVLSEDEYPRIAEIISGANSDGGE